MMCPHLKTHIMISSLTKMWLPNNEFLLNICVTLYASSFLNWVPSLLKVYILMKYNSYQSKQYMIILVSTLADEYFCGLSSSRNGDSHFYLTLILTQQIKCNQFYSYLSEAKCSRIMSGFKIWKQAICPFILEYIKNIV